MKNKKAFTLIELLLVITIMAIVSALAIPGIISAVKESRTKEYQEYEQTLKNALEIYNIDYKEDLWGAGETTQTVTVAELKLNSPDLDINHKKCDIIGNFTITKLQSGYKYKICIECDEDFKTCD